MTLSLRKWGGENMEGLTLNVSSICIENEKRKKSVIDHVLVQRRRVMFCIL